MRRIVPAQHASPLGAKAGLALLAIACLAVQGCNGSTQQLRPVGASSPATVSAPTAVEPPAGDDAVVRIARDERLQVGTSMNLGPEASPSTAARQAETSQAAAYAAPEELPPRPQMGTTRAEAIEQIRAKATDRPDVAPHVFGDGRAATRQMGRGERDRLRAEMRQTAARNAEVLDAEQAEAKAAAARNLRYRAKTHYDEALEEIE